MNLLKGLGGLVVIMVIFVASFYAYSSLSGKSNNPPAETATVLDSSIDNLAPERANEKIAKSSKATTTTNQPSLDGLNEGQLQEGLERIKAGLELLQNPVE